MARAVKNVWSQLIEPKRQIAEDRKIFSNRSLKAMVIPLFAEQSLTMLVGVADTLMVSYAGESAISGVTLANMFNTIFIYLFVSLASGGAIVISQYIGSKERENSGLAASQLYTISIVFAVVCAGLVLTFSGQISGFLFGRAAADVTNASTVYLQISAYAYPALAVYNAGAALYRSIGNTGVVMKVSLFMNAVNIIGNAIGIFVLHAGAAGVAWPSTISRVLAAVVMTKLCFGNQDAIPISWAKIRTWNRGMVKKLLMVAVPNGIDNGGLQLTKVALSSIMAMFGTSQIAANGIAQSIWVVAALVGVSMGPVFITVIGQCTGSGDMEAVDYYMRKLLRITILFSTVWNGLILAITPFVLMAYHISAETKSLVFVLVAIHNVFCCFAFPLASPFSSGLRAAGDIRFTMYVSTLSTTVFRVFLSIVLGIWCGLGVTGIAWGMVLDWLLKAVIFMFRYRSGKWKRFDIIGRNG